MLLTILEGNNPFTTSKTKSLMKALCGSSPSLYVEILPKNCENGT
jgi:hypothetical protein